MFDFLGSHHIYDDIYIYIMLDDVASAETGLGHEFIILLGEFMSQRMIYK